MCIRDRRYSIKSWIALRLRCRTGSAKAARTATTNSSSVFGGVIGWTTCGSLRAVSTRSAALAARVNAIAAKEKRRGAVMDDQQFLTVSFSSRLLGRLHAKVE